MKSNRKILFNPFMVSLSNHVNDILSISFMILSSSVFFATVSLQAKLYVPQSDEQFYREVARHNLAVVHFNPYPVDSTEFKLERMKDAFVTLANSDRFKDADVAFIGVNLHVVPELVDDFDLELAPIINGEQGKDIDHADLLEDELASKKEQKKEKDADVAMKHISEIKPEEQAVLMLFKDGKPITDGGKKVMRTGFMSKIELQDFINKYFGSAIDERLAQKKEQERQRMQVRYVEKPKRQLVERVYYTDDYAYAPDYYYYPTYRRTGYYGYPYGYWPGFGMGFGFGGRRGGFSFGFGW